MCHSTAQNHQTVAAARDSDSAPSMTAAVRSASRRVVVLSDSMTHSLAKPGKACTKSHLGSRHFLGLPRANSRVARRTRPLSLRPRVRYKRLRLLPRPNPCLGRPRSLTPLRRGPEARFLAFPRRLPLVAVLGGFHAGAAVALHAPGAPACRATDPAAPLPASGGAPPGLAA